MIFLTVGTQMFQFDRLLKAVDELIDQNIIQETVIAQSGYSTYVPRNFRADPFLEPEEFKHLVESCDLLITHGGVSTILTGLSAQKKMVVVPRKKVYFEHVDDHQEEIAAKFEELRDICVCRNVDELSSCYHRARNSTQLPSQVRLYFSNTTKFVNRILEELG